MPYTQDDHSITNDQGGYTQDDHSITTDQGGKTVSLLPMRIETSMVTWSLGYKEG